MAWAEPRLRSHFLYLFKQGDDVSPNELAKSDYQFYRALVESPSYRTPEHGKPARWDVFFEDCGLDFSLFIFVQYLKRHEIPIDLELMSRIPILKSKIEFIKKESNLSLEEYVKAVAKPTKVRWNLVKGLRDPLRLTMLYLFHLKFDISPNALQKTAETNVVGAGVRSNTHYHPAGSSTNWEGLFEDSGLDLSFYTFIQFLNLYGVSIDLDILTTVPLFQKAIEKIAKSGITLEEFVEKTSANRERMRWNAEEYSSSHYYAFTYLFHKGYDVSPVGLTLTDESNALLAAIHRNPHFRIDPKGIDWEKFFHDCGLDYALYTLVQYLKLYKIPLTEEAFHASDIFKPALKHIKEASNLSIDEFIHETTAKRSNVLWLPTPTTVKPIQFAFTYLYYSGEFDVSPFQLGENPQTMNLYAAIKHSKVYNPKGNRLDWKKLCNDCSIPYTPPKDVGWRARKV